MSPELVMEISIEIFLLQALKANAFIRSFAHIHQRRQRHYKWCLKFHCTADLPHHHLQSYKTYLEHTDMVNDTFSFIVLIQFMVCNLVITSWNCLLFFWQGTSSTFGLFPMSPSSFSEKNLKCWSSLASNPSPLPFPFISLHSYNFNYQA